MALNGEDAILAAELGKQLLVENTELRAKLEAITKKYDNFQIDSLIQENYELNSKYDGAVKVQLQLEDEVDRLVHKLDLADQCKEDQKKIELLESKLKTAATLQVEEEAHKCSTLQSRVNELEAQLNIMLAQTNDKNTSLLIGACKSEESYDVLLEEKEQLSLETTQLKMQVNSMKNVITDNSSQLESNLEEIKNLKLELEDTKHEALSYFSALEKARGEIMDLRCLMDAENSTVPHNAKGNSLFSELDDYRLNAEQSLREVKLENNTLRNTLNVKEHQLQKIKMKLSHALVDASSGISSKQIDSLQNDLDNSFKYIEKLTYEVHDLRRENIHLSASTKNLNSCCGDSSMTQVLEAIIKAKQAELEKMQKKLATTEMTLIAERQCMAETKRKLALSERLVEQKKSQISVLEMERDDHKIKKEINIEKKPSTSDRINSKKEVVHSRTSEPDDLSDCNQQ